MMNKVIVKGPGNDVSFSNELPLSVIAGPCVIEGYDFAMRTAEKLREIFSDAGIPFIYKSSFDKANRSSVDSFRGVGLDEGLNILSSVRREVGVPVLTDIHTQDQAVPVAEIVDMLQTPSFLCRQTDFIQAAASAGKPLNVKKGQFLSPGEMANVCEKIEATGNREFTLCERGTSFGYGNLVVDMRSLVEMARTGYPVIFDATHSVQLPGGQGKSTGGKREFVPPLARAAVAVGVAGLFIESHPDPDQAPCDGPNMISFSALPALLDNLKRIDAEVKKLELN